MPFACPLPIRSLSREEFEERDQIVMSCAYASQNELGRLCDERVYENDVAARLRTAGLNDIQWINLAYGVIQFVSLARGTRHARTGNGMGATE